MFGTRSDLGEVLRAMRWDPRTKPEAQQWREMAFREKAPLLVFSTLSKLADGYSFSIHCEQIGNSPESPVQSWDDTETAMGPAELFEAVRKVATRVRLRAGEDAAEISATNLLPQDITSSRWEALELYGDAQSLSDEQRSDDAVPLLRRAVDLDPKFAMGLMRLGDILDAQDKVEEGRAYWRKAIELAKAQHLSDHERLNIESRYQLEISDFSKAEPILLEWARKFPNDPEAQELLAWCLLQTGNYAEAVRVARDGQDRFSPTVFGTSVLIRSLAAEKDVADLDQQITVLEKLSSKSLALGFRAFAALLRADYDLAASLLREAMRSDDVRESSRATALLANLEADQGQFEAAQKLLSEGILKDRKTGQDGFAAEKTIALAFLEGLTGNQALAAARAQQAVSIKRSPRVIVQAVAILARNGSPKDAASLMDTFPAGEGPKHEADLLRMRGEILAAEGRFKPALEDLERAANLDRPHEPKEYLARAYDLAGDRVQAKLVYQQIVDTSFLTWIIEDQWPATRLLATRYLKNFEGRKK